MNHLKVGISSYLQIIDVYINTIQLIIIILVTIIMVSKLITPSSNYYF